MHRDKFFWVAQSLFNWPYQDRRAIGVKLSDAWFKNKPIYRFEINGEIYEIERAKAEYLGKKYTLKYGALPNILPLSEFRQEEKKKEVVIPRNEPKQLNLLIT